MKLVTTCVFVMLALATPVSAQSVEAFGRLPAVADVAISPDGRRIAVATSDLDGGGAVMIIDVDQPSQRTGYSVGEDIQLRAVGWADNERVSYLLSQTVRPHQVLPARFYFVGAPRRIDYFRWGTINTATGRSILLTTNPENAWADQGGVLISPIEGDPGYARMTGRSASLQRRREALFRINLDNGRVRELAPSGINEDTIDFVIDRAGRVVARLDSDEATNRWRLFVYDGAIPRLLIEDISDFGEPLSVQGLAPDGRMIASRYNEAGFAALYAIDPTTGAVQTLYEVENNDVDSALIDPWTREVVGVTWTAIEREQRFFEADLEQARLAIAQNLTVPFRIESWSQDRLRFIVYAESGMDGGSYHVFNRADSSIRMLTPRYPELVRSPGGQRQSITYRARDGARVPAYLTLPRDVEPRNLPVVVLVHGGPHSRDTMDFDWWAAFLVSRGYAVLQPNFRGSSGYGQAWEEAGRRQWGGLMQTDVEDGAAALVRAGIADQGRVCIVGASYGGYAALAGAALTPDRYRCAVSVAGVSDLIMMLTQTERQTGDDSISSDWWRASIGDRQEDRERVRSVSPVFMADRVRIPVLLIHGTDDTVVPIEQSRRMLRALQSAGKDVRFVEQRGDDHWLSDAPTRIQMLREIETFLAQHLGAAAAN